MAAPVVEVGTRRLPLTTELSVGIDLVVLSYRYSELRATARPTEPATRTSRCGAKSHCTPPYAAADGGHSRAAFAEMMGTCGPIPSARWSATPGGVSVGAFEALEQPEQPAQGVPRRASEDADSCLRIPVSSSPRPSCKVHQERSGIDVRIRDSTNRGVLLTV